MKTTYFSPRLFTLLLAQSVSCLHPTRSRSQTSVIFLGKQKYLAPQEDRFYNSFIWNEGVLQTNNTLGRFDLSFDYSVKQWKSNAATNYNVHKSYTNLVAPNLSMRDFFGFESGWKNNFINFHMGTLHNYDAAADQSMLGLYGSVGYGYNFFCIGRGDHLSDKRIVIKPSVNLLISGFNLNLLTLPDAGQEVDLLGYNENSYSKDSTSESFVNLKVTFRQRSVAFMPQISITDNPFRYRLHWGVNVSWLLPIADRGYIYLFQKGTTNGDGDADDPPTGHPGDKQYINLSAGQLNATYNNKTISQSPFSLHGLYVGFSVGINLD
ncbi:MAG TPA: hypothetical protein VNZ49_10805 [Bacteroidia bacterium]|jgi:hypothetical protein|nr:hypothetical protein [Bacteroidia bacterium]